MPDVKRRIAKETVTAKVNGVNTVVAQAGQVVPLAYADLVPDSKSEPADSTALGTTRSTLGRREAAAKREEEAKPRKAAPKAESKSESKTAEK